jgi:hypothetical protein
LRSEDLLTRLDAPSAFTASKCLTELIHYQKSNTIMGNDYPLVSVSLRKKVDEPSDAPKSPIGRQFES